MRTSRENTDPSHGTGSMTVGFRGCDPDNMFAVADSVSVGSDTLDVGGYQLDSALANLYWVGSDADLYRQRWAETVQSVITAREVLAACASHLTAQANQQLDASGEAGLGSEVPLTDASVGSRGIIGTGEIDRDLKIFVRDTDLDGHIGGAKFLDEIDGLDGRPKNRRLLGGDVIARLHHAEGRASVWGEQRGGTRPVGGADVSGEVDVRVLSAEGEASSGLQLDPSKGSVGGYAEAKGGAYLAAAGASGGVTYGLLSASGSAEAMVGLEGEAGAKAAIGMSGVALGAHAEAFAGAKASATANVNVGGVGATGTAEAWAGIGAKADADVEISAHKVKVGAEFGVALGLGGSLGFEVEIDPIEVVNNLNPMNWFGAD